jgi:hypothetical protein
MFTAELVIRCRTAKFADGWAKSAEVLGKYFPF